MNKLIISAMILASIGTSQAFYDDDEDSQSYDSHSWGKGNLRFEEREYYNGDRVHCHTTIERNGEAYTVCEKQ